MNAMVRQRFAQQYTQTSLQTGIENATPHRLVQMLYEGVLDRVAQAKGAILRKDYETKARLTNRIIDILNHLQMSLDAQKGAEVAENLDGLYRYMMQQVLDASRYNDVQRLDEVLTLVRDIKSAWDEMPETYRRMGQAELAQLQP